MEPQEASLTRRAGRFTALALATWALLLGHAHAAETLPLDMPGLAKPVGTEAAANPRMHRVPLAFVENHGQIAEPVAFAVDGRGYTTYFTSAEVVTVPRRTRASVLRQSFDGANTAACIEGLAPSGGHVHSIRGADPTQWITNAPTFGKVAYRDLYPGIDAIWYGTEDNRLEYDFVVAPGADPRQIRMRFGGTQSITIEENGDLLFTLDEATLRKQKPFVYQETPSGRVIVEARYELIDDAVVGFELGVYDPTRPVVIDPVVLTSTYLGGTFFDDTDAVALDDAGNIYVLGDTTSTNFPTTDPLQPANAGSDDIFITKFDPTGTSQIWSTYIGGSNSDTSRGLVIDDAGRVWILGTSSSSNFPVHSPLQGSLAGQEDVVLLALDAAGSSLLFSTYYGGSDFESAGALVRDASGALYLSGDTESTDFPTAAPLQSQLAGESDAFLVKIDPSAGPGVVYATYLGGTDDEDANTLATHGGRVYVAGRTFSNDFPTASPLQAANAGFVDAFVCVVNGAGTSLVYSTYFGGSEYDDADRIAIDAAGNIWFAGETESTDLPLASAIQTNNAGSQDIFLAKLDPSGATLLVSTYLGGPDEDAVDDLAFDTAGSILLSGNAGAQFPTHNAWQSFGGDIDAVLVKLTPSGTAIEFSSYIGGSNEELGSEIAVRGTDIIVTGTTSSGDFPTVMPYQSNLGGDQDVFLMTVRDLRVHVSPADSVLLDTQELTLALVVEGSAQAQWSRIAFNGIDRTQFVLDRATTGTLGGTTPGITLRLPIRVQQIVNALGTGPVTVTAEATDGSTLFATNVTWRILDEAP